MQAIETKYFGPTNNKGSRIKASCDAKTRFYSYSELQDQLLKRGIPCNTDYVHMLAAELLTKELEWAGELMQGWLKSGSYVHVFPGRSNNEIQEVIK